MLGALLVNVPYNLLIANFEYPDILREDTATILAEFADGGDGLIYTWLAFAWSGLPILIAIFGLRQILDEEGSHPWIGTATTIGVIGAVVQIVGLLRWVFVVPGLAAAHATPGATESARSSAEVTFDAVHQYGGVVIGEHLGQLFTTAWIIMIAAMMFQSKIFNRWLGVFGLIAAALYSVAQLELMSTVIDEFPHWDQAGLIGSLLWLAWMFTIGIRLLTIKDTSPDEHENATHRGA